MHRTSARPLALIYAGLIFYASLYPFSGWRYQGIVPWAFLSSPLPKYWTGFDVAVNVLGYMPLGFLLVLSALRSQRTQHAVVLATLLASALSATMESLQSYLPARVASNVDLGLNLVGAWLGAMLAWRLEKLGALDRWSRFRARWFVADARGGLVLLAVWPLALLFPAAVPFGLGQVLERLEAALAGVLHDTPFLDWLPVRDIELQPLVPGVELVCVALGLLIPCLLGYCIIRTIARRTLFLLLVFSCGVAVTALSAALSYGPGHAWAWLSLPVEVGLVIALVLGILLLWVPRRISAALVLLALGIYLSLLNQAPTSSYFAQTLSTWEQGRFIRFHGLAQWLGWLWPYAVLVYALTQVGGREPKN
ncbi:MAG: VanZ family protein [Rhodoferax sp.]|uniref:VanZ family protein n=1 Tax=Rhodoferax sp. TaxID=50421 RepID=UPI00261474A8|nr:VanZ family protein [Rhodoferax sp.]MDD5335909.1 VanZ family protein [Rhodoferax sp.]